MKLCVILWSLEKVNSEYIWNTYIKFKWTKMARLKSGLKKRTVLSSFCRAVARARYLWSGQIKCLGGKMYSSPPPLHGKNFSWSWLYGPEFLLLIHFIVSSFFFSHYYYCFSPRDTTARSYQYWDLAKGRISPKG